MIFIITAESDSERILKIGQHLPKLWAIKYRVVFLWNTVYIRIFCQVAVLFGHDNIFVFIHQVAPVPACWLLKPSATSWPLTFWPWKWCPSYVWRGLPLCQF